MSTIPIDAGVSRTAHPSKPAAAVPRSRLSEDWVAVVIGSLVIAIVLGVFAWKVVDLGKVVSSYRWTTDAQLASMSEKWVEQLDTTSREANARGEQQVAALSTAVKDALEKGDRKEITAAAAKLSKLGAKTLPGALGAEIRGHAAADATATVLTWENLSKALYVGVGRPRPRNDRYRAPRRHRSAAFIVGVPVVFAACVVRTLSRGQRTLRELGHRVRDLRARARASHQQHDRRARMAQAGGTDRILHQDGTRHPRREPALHGSSAGRRARHRPGGARRVRRLVCVHVALPGNCAWTTSSARCYRPPCRSAACRLRSRPAEPFRATRRSSPTSLRSC